MITALLIAIGVALASGAVAYFMIKKNRKLKLDLVKAQAKAKAMKEQWDVRVINEQKLRQKLAEDRTFRKKMKEVKTDEEAVALTDDLFTRIGKL